MDVSGRKSPQLWYAAALLFAVSAAVLFFHHDVLSGTFWLIMSALGIIFARAYSNGCDEGCDRLNHTNQQAP